MAPAKKPDKQVTRYTYDDFKEPRTPETECRAGGEMSPQLGTMPWWAG